MGLEDLKSNFVSMISHELREPLAVMKGYLALVKEGGKNKLDKEQREYLGIVDSKIDEMTELIDNIIEYSRMEAGRFVLNTEQVDLRELIEEIREKLKNEFAEKGLKFNAVVKDGIGVIETDRLRFQKILLIILDNALKYTNEGRVDLTVRAEKNSVLIEIADTGMGIEKEQRQKIFYSFYQAEDPLIRSAGGIGIGLAVAKRIVEEMGGNIEADSEGKGKGSRFRIKLPLKTSVK